MRGLLLACCAWAWGGLAGPEADYVVAKGKLSGRDFHRLVACGAAPGQPCPYALLRWSPDRARRVAVGFAPVPPGYPADQRGRMDRALDRAVAEINGAGAALRLVRGTKEAALDVTVFLVASGQDEPIRGTGGRGLDGIVLGAGLVDVWPDGRGDIASAAIVMARDLPAEQVGPVLLEELAQAMGLLTDVRDPYYEPRSVFSEDGNLVARLGPQDRDALRRHYPPGKAPPAVPNGAPWTP